MKKERTLQKKTNLQQFSAWLRNELQLYNSLRASYSCELISLDTRLEKSGEGSLLLRPSIDLILELIHNRVPKIRVNREKTMALIHYLSFLISIGDEVFITKEVLEAQLTPSQEDFVKWIKCNIGYTSHTHTKWNQSCVWQQPATYAETSIREYIENKAIIAQSYNDRKIWPVYLTYLASLAIGCNSNLFVVLKELESQTGFYPPTDEKREENLNYKAFEDWISKKNTAPTCRKYLSSLRGVNSTAKRVLRNSLLREQSVANVFAILNTLITMGKLDKGDRKVAALYLSYQTQHAATIGTTLVREAKTIRPTKIEFENWLVSFVGMGRTPAKAHAAKAEEISAHLSPIGFSLFTVNSAFELKALEPLFVTAISNPHVLTLDYYYAYIHSSIPGIEEIKAFNNGEEETKVVKKTKPSFEVWCLGKELVPSTIKSMQKFLGELTRYCQSRGINFDHKTDSDIANVTALLDLYTNQQAYHEILTDGKVKNYTDRYCSYLLDKIALREIDEVLSQKDNQWQYPILVVAEKKQVAAKFTAWLKAGRYCDDNSTRTFVSSLYSAEDLVREQFNDSLMENPYKRRIAYLRLLAIEKPQFKTDWKRPLRLFVQFLSEFRIISKEEHFENIKKIKDIILLLFNGAIQNEAGTDYQRICAELNSMPSHPIRYREEDIMSIVKQLTVHDKQSDTLILQEAFLPDDLTANLLQYVQGVFASGCPVVTYEELRKKLPENRQTVHTDTLRQFLTMVGEGIFSCETRCIRSIDSSKETENFPTIISDKLREIKKPVSKNELVALLPSISERIITRILVQNNIGINIGIVNPKRENIFHADIVELTKNERSDIIGVIIETLHSNYYITSSQLYKLIKNKVPKLFKRYAFLTKGALFRVLRYKLKDLFNFSISCITFSGTVDISSIFKSYCAQHKRIKLSQLIQFEKELGGCNIPFEQIYETHARVNQDELIRRNQLHFDILAIDSSLQGICQQTLLPISRFNAYDKLPLVSGFEWTPFLLEHYLSYHSHKFSFYKRNFSRNGCYGFILPRATDISDFDEAVARYIWFSGYELDADTIVTHLQEIGIIGARKYANIDQIILRVREIQSLL